MANNGSQMPWFSTQDDISSAEIYQTILMLGALSFLLLVLHYHYTLLCYHHGHAFRGHAKGRLPPQYPTLVPYLGPVIQVWHNHGGFVRRVSSYAGRLTSNRVTLMGHTLYNFQDRETITALFKQSKLFSAIHMSIFAHSHLFGTSREAMAIYKADNSGPFPKPHPKSNVSPNNRIDYITHNIMSRGLTGVGLQPTVRRFAVGVSHRLDGLNITEDWTEMSDFAQFIRHIVSFSILQSIFGPTMIRLNPTFVDDIFTLDQMLPAFALGLPRFMMPKAYRFRDSLIIQFKNWYRYGRENFAASQIDDDGDGDPVWGSAMMRQRQEAILQVDQHDDDALARADLGFAWGAIGNAEPIAMLSALHIFKEKGLLDRVRRDISQCVGERSVRDTEPQQLSKDTPLLSSIYAETLRLHLKLHSVYSSPHEDVDLGKWVLPKGALAFLTSEPSHLDETFWNTRDGQYPVRSFWADRFIVDPLDPQSGPIRPECRKPTPRSEGAADRKPYFSTRGCEGAWIPYGGGYSMCPGRFLAKNMITYTSALLASEYDIEICSDSIQFSDKRYGMGVEELKHAIPFRIRRRAVGNK